MSSVVTQKGEVLFFGGQDSEQHVLYNDVYTLDPSNFSLKHQQYKDA